MDLRRNSVRNENLEEVSRLILESLVQHGPATVTELIERVKVRPRDAISAIDQLEASGLVEVAVHGVQEVVKLAESDRQNPESS
jgi:DNA-binding MarR family transcriptional regulator